MYSNMPAEAHFGGRVLWSVAFDATFFQRVDWQAINPANQFNWQTVAAEENKTDIWGKWKWIWSWCKCQPPFSTNGILTGSSSFMKVRPRPGATLTPMAPTGGQPKKCWCSFNQGFTRTHWGLSWDYLLNVLALQGAPITDAIKKYEHFEWWPDFHVIKQLPHRITRIQKQNSGGWKWFLKCFESSTKPFDPQEKKRKWSGLVWRKNPLWKIPYINSHARMPSAGWQLRRLEIPCITENVNMEYIQHYFLLIIQKLVFIQIYQIQKDTLSLRKHSTNIILKNLKFF